MSSSDYIFRRTGENVYERELFGMERKLSTMQEYFRGLGQLTVSASVRIPTMEEKEKLSLYTRNAWIALRHLIPLIATKTFKLSTHDNRFALLYTVPTTVEEIELWADTTVVFSEGFKVFYDNHLELQNSVWWRPSDSRYNAELHVLPLSNGWQFSMVVAHNIIDGRNAFILMDIFLSYIAKQLENTAEYISDLKWGDEVHHLTPPSPFIKTIVESGTPPELTKAHAHSIENKQKLASETMQQLRPWTYKPIRSGESRDIGRVVKFTAKQSSMIYAAAKKRGRTITQAMTALTALAISEALLKVAGEMSNERYKEVSNSFSAAKDFVISFNPVNQRHKFPGGYDSFHSKVGSPLLASDVLLLSFPMDAIRNLLSLDKETKSVVRNIDDTAFWDGLVAQIASMWESADTSLDAHFIRDSEVHFDLDSGLDTQAFDDPYPLISSIGDLGRLHILSNYLPSVKNGMLEVDDVLCGTRMGIHPILNLLYQFNGELSCHFIAGADYITADSLQLVTDIFEELALLVSDPPIIATT